MKHTLLFFLILLSFTSIFAQIGGNINGNFQTIMQTYKKDTLIGADDAAEKILLNSYANFIYSNEKFTAGLRYEGYFNTLQGYDSKNDGFGFPYRFAQYKADLVDITVGNYYEQFGSGLILRTYEDKYIGYDNALDGLRVKISPKNGLKLTGIIGRQRYSFSKNNYGYSNVIYKGLVRGIDLEFSPTSFFKKFETSKSNLIIGYSFVSKFQPKQNVNIILNDTTYLLDIPENIASMSGRLAYSIGSFAINGEYAYKFNDPSAENNFIFKSGNALFLNLSFSKPGFGIILTAKRIDNMGFRSDRNASLSDLNINYIPDITRNHTYAFTAFYPYANQNSGEMGIGSEITFKLKKNSMLGGKYGCDIRLNYSRMNSIDKQKIIDSIEIGQKGTDGYISDYFKIGKDIYYQDINIQIDKKVSKAFKFTLIYQNLIFNYSILRGEPGEETVYANIGLLDMTFKLSTKSYLRLETEAIFTEQDMGNWGMLLAEYTISPHWFFSAADQYNYKNPDGQEAHYYNFACGYKINSTRIQLSYGRQRAGVVCIGGVCRSVPATNGFMFTLNSSF